MNNAVSAIIINVLDLYAGGTFTNVGGSGRIAQFQIDGTPPAVDSFIAISPSNGNIPITAFTVFDNASVTGYEITESATPPAASDAGWTASAPSTYTVASSGDYTLYPWAKDASGNVSAVYSSPASVTVDVTAPTVTSFTVPASTNSLTVPITAFTASDNIGVAGHLITESSTPPAAGDSGWTASAPTSYTFSSYGNKTIYPWDKDAVGNVSPIYGLPVAVAVCGTAITVTSTGDSGTGTLRQAIINVCSGVPSISTPRFRVGRSDSIPA